MWPKTIPFLGQMKSRPPANRAVDEGRTKGGGTRDMSATNNRRARPIALFPPGRSPGDRRTMA